MVTSPKAAAAKADDVIDDVAAAANKTFETPAQVRDLAEKGVQQAKQTYSRLKSASEEATDALEDVYATLSKNYKEFGKKSVEATRSNVNAHFDFLASLIAARSLSEAVELQASYARRQFEVVGAQAKELSALAQRAAADSAKPFQDVAAKGLKFAPTR